MKTHLIDSHNNKKVTISDNKIDRADLISSIKYRITKHKEFIKRHEKTIIANINFANIVTDEIDRINERKAKIGELREFIKYCL